MLDIFGNSIFWIRGHAPPPLAVVLCPRGGWGLRDALRAYKTGGIETLVSLLEEKEAQRLGLAGEGRIAKKAGLRFLSHPMPDHSLPADEEAFRAFVCGLAERLRDGERIGLHCLGSIGRATMMAACTLIELGWEPPAALAAVEAARCCRVPDTEEQEEWILGYKPAAVIPVSIHVPARIPAPFRAPISPPIVDIRFPHAWEARILAECPPILPQRHFIYPAQVEEVERGALEVQVQPVAPGSQSFLTTCALGFRDPAVPTGIWSAPRAEEICAVSGGYAFLIDTTAPERFTMIPYRPVLEVRPVVAQDLLLFVGHHAILAWGREGRAWESEKLSDEGVTINSIEGNILRGMGWEMMSDKERPFALDLRTGQQLPSSRS
jgi:protein-tyrosine phosphatase